MYFQWREEYCIYVGEIDRQHKKMFEIGRRISDLVLAADGYDHIREIISVLQELREYAKYHFKGEEKLMEQYGYREAAVHRIEHKFFIKRLEKLEKLQGEDMEAKRKQAVIELITFISDWISLHILKTDMRFKEFFKNQGLSDK